MVENLLNQGSRHKYSSIDEAYKGALEVCQVLRERVGWGLVQGRIAQPLGLWILDRLDSELAMEIEQAAQD